MYNRFSLKYLGSMIKVHMNLSKMTSRGEEQIPLYQKELAKL